MWNKLLLLSITWDRYIRPKSDDRINRNRMTKYYMSRKGPKVGHGMLDFVEDNFVGVKSH